MQIRGSPISCFLRRYVFVVVGFFCQPVCTGSKPRRPLLLSKHSQLSEQPACKVICIPVLWKGPLGFASVFPCAGKTYGSGPGDLSPNPITQLSHAKSPLMALHVPELRMMMFANESSVDIPYWKRWPLHTEQPRGPTA